MKLKYIFPIILLPVFSWQSVSASETSFRLSDTTQNREVHSIISKLDSPLAQAWANNRLSHLTKELKKAKKLTGNRSDAKAYRTEIASEITKVIDSLKAGNISFSITDNLKTEVEKDVITYQKSFVAMMREYMQKGLLSDMHETGNTHFTLKSKSANISIDLDPYKVTLSKDRKNIEIDAKILATIDMEKEGSASGMIDGNIKIIGSDLFITLRDYQIGTTLIGNSKSDDIVKTLSEMKGKTYHQKLDSDAIKSIEMSQKDPAEMIKKLSQIMDILSTESLLTPIATEGSDAILMFKKETIAKLSNIFDENTKEVLDLTDAQMMIPMDIRTDGKNIKIHGFEDGANIQATLSHHIDNTPLLTFEARERGKKNPTNVTLEKTPTYWIFSGTNEGYIMEAKASSSGTIATVKNGSKTIATAKIDANGVDAWTYDFGTLWEWTKYDYDTESDITDSIAMRLWGSLRDEFGTFQITPPTISEELEKTTLGAKNAKEQRDQKHIENIRAMRSGLENFFEEKGSYPIPKENCIDLSEIKAFIPEYYSYIDIPQTPTSDCKNGYFYKLIVSNGKKVPLLATQVEVKNEANYDNSISISDIRIRKNLSLFGEIESNDPKDWLYVTYY